MQCVAGELLESEAVVESDWEENAWGWMAEPLGHN